eukprot:7378437-Prymnesium_polylepis.2
MDGAVLCLSCRCAVRVGCRMGSRWVVHHHRLSGGLERHGRMNALHVAPRCMVVRREHACAPLRTCADNRTRVWLALKGLSQWLKFARAQCVTAARLVVKHKSTYGCELRLSA